MRAHAVVLVWAMAASTSFASVAGGSAVKPPVAPARPVVDEYHGYRVVDPYRWLEDWGNQEVRAWSEAQNAFARGVLDNLPGRAAIQARVAQLVADTSPSYFGLKVRGGVLFALKGQPPKQQPVLVTLASVDDLGSERVVLDPNVLDPSGATTIDFYEPSRDAQVVAVSLSVGGTEDGTVRVIEVASGKERPDRVPHVNGGTAGGSVAWNPDRTGFWYTRYPAPGERPEADLPFFQQIWFHRLGDPLSADRYSFGKEFPRIAETRLETSDDGRSVIATVENGDGGEYEHFLLVGGDTWRRLTRFEDQVKDTAFGAGALYLLSYRDAPRGRVLRVALTEPSLDKAVVVVTESDSAIEGIATAFGSLFVRDQVGGPSRVRRFDATGRVGGVLPAPEVASVSLPVPLGGDAVLYHVTTFVDPPAWYRYELASGKASRTALAKLSVADFSGCDVLRETAISRDGTRVPVSIMRRKGTTLNRDNPALLTGYGGFSISTGPHFDAAARAWLEQGGVLALANIRGGGEFGEPWHAGGKGAAKQNVFDDFAACARLLIDQGYTRPARLAIEGGSNGGLLMGAMLTQHPELVRAVVAHVGLLDMLRFERFPNGVFNVTEYGTVADREQFLAIRAYSPYQNVVPGVAYPAVLFLTGANDPRVDPANSRKMTALMQACTSSGLPVLLRTSSTTGHLGSPLSERVAVATDVYSFLFHELGVAYQPVPTGDKPRAGR